MPLRDRPLPPQRDDLHPGSDDDPGAMGINYRCEPMVERWSRPEQSITAVSAPWRKTAGKRPSSPHRGRRPSGSSSCSPTVASACWTKTAISSRPRSRAWNPEKRAATKPRTTRTPGKRATTTAQSGSSTVCKGSPHLQGVQLPRPWRPGHAGVSDHISNWNGCENTAPVPLTWCLLANGVEAELLREAAWDIVRAEKLWYNAFNLKTRRQSHAIHLLSQMHNLPESPKVAGRQWHYLRIAEYQGGESLGGRAAFLAQGQRPAAEEVLQHQRIAV